jgi:hypothetical protein
MLATRCGSKTPIMSTREQMPKGTADRYSDMQTGILRLVSFAN